MISDLGIIFKVYLISLGLQFLVWPWVNKWFKELADGGWALGRILGLLAIGLPVWFLGHVWPVNTDVGVGVVVMGLVLAGLRSLRGVKKPQWPNPTSARWPKGSAPPLSGGAPVRIGPLKMILVEEGLFLLGFLGLSLIRGFQPDILGLEKFMDFGFVKQYLITTRLPADDMWLAGKSINYYSFGHFLTSILVRIWGVGLGVGYNLMLAWILGNSLILSFSAIVNLLYRSHLGGAPAAARSPSEERSEPLFAWIVGGVMGALLTSLGGNSHAWWYLLKNRGFAGYWYADATRFITNTIHEFPGYSFVVSDLHAHVLGLPMVLAFVSVLVGMIDRPRLGRTPAAAGSPSEERPSEIGPLRHAVVLGVLLGVMVMTNTWDVAVYGLLLVVFGFIWLIRKGPTFLRPDDRKGPPRHYRMGFLLGSDLLRLGLVILGVAGVVALPWSLNFKFFSDGVRLTTERSPVWQMGVLWGGHIVVTAIAVILNYKLQISNFKFLPSRLKCKRNGEIPFNCKSTGHRDSSTTLGMTKKQQIDNKRHSGDEFGRGLQNPVVLALGITALLLLMIPEVMYVKDIYTTHQRANTMFKLTYQAFIMMSLLFGWVVGRALNDYRYCGNLKLQITNYKFQILAIWQQIARGSDRRLFRFDSRIPPRKTPCKTGSLKRLSPPKAGRRPMRDPLNRFSRAMLCGGVSVLWGGLMLFPIQAFSSYYGGFKKYRGLDGLRWIDKDKKRMIEYLEKNRDGKNLVEAVGDSYSKLNSVSVFSGTPAVVGWKVHEWLWRGGYAVVAERESRVRDFYEKGDRKFLEDFKVGWIVVGYDEKKRYDVDENKLLRLGEVVWMGEESYLIQVD